MCWDWKTFKGIFIKIEIQSLQVLNMRKKNNYLQLVESLPQIISQKYVWFTEQLGLAFHVHGWRIVDFERSPGIHENPVHVLKLLCLDLDLTLHTLTSNFMHIFSKIIKCDIQLTNFFTLILYKIHETNIIIFFATYNYFNWKCK